MLRKYTAEPKLTRLCEIRCSFLYERYMFCAHPERMLTCPSSEKYYTRKYNAYNESTALNIINDSIRNELVWLDGLDTRRTHNSALFC